MHKKTSSLPLSLKPRTQQSVPLSRYPAKTPDLHLYNYFTDSQSNRASKFFTNNSNSVSKSTILKTCDPPTIPTWEINERLESFKFRSLKPAGQKLSIEILQKDFTIWEKTSSEINKILNHFSEDLGEVMISFSSYNKKVYMDMFEYCKISLSKAKRKVEKYKSVILGLNRELAQMNEKLQYLGKIQLMDNEKIEREIKEIFGDFAVDTEEIRDKIKKMRKKEAVPAAEFLKEALEKLRIEQKLPDLDPSSPRPFDLNDYETTLNTRMRNIQVSTAQKIINYFESKDNLTSKTTQTVEELISLRTFNETKEALDKSNLHVSSLTLQLDKARSKIIECENNLNNLLQEKGKLLTENLLKNNEIQNFLEKEKILKSKIMKLKTEENLMVVGGNPYLKEKPASPVSNASPGFFSMNPRLSYKQLIEQESGDEDALSQRKSGEEDGLKIPSNRHSVMDESKSSFYSSIRSKSSASNEDLEKQEEFKENIETFEYNDEKSEGDKSNGEIDSDSDIKPLAKTVKKETNLKNLFTKEEVHERMSKVQQNSRRPAIFKSNEVKKVISSHDIEKSISKQEKPKINPKSNNKQIVLSEKGKTRINEKTSKVNQIITPDEIRAKLETKTEKSIEKNEKYVRNIEKEAKMVKKVSFDKKTETKTTSAMLFNDSDKNLYSELSKHSVQKEDSFFKDELLDQHINSNESHHKSFQDEKPKTIVNLQNKSMTDVKSARTKIKSRSLANEKTLKLSKIDKPAFPDIKRPKPIANKEDLKHQQQIKDLINQIKRLESSLKSIKTLIDASVNTDPLPTSVETADFGSQVGSDPIQRSKDPLIYMMPYNPNNIYGLKADRYFTSTGVFSAQPQIPDLTNSYVFTSPYHLSNPNIN